MNKEYENKYHILEKNHFWFKSRRAYIQRLLLSEPKSSKVLDIGCSSGVLLDELRNMGFDSHNLYGIDISPTAIENCKQINLNNCFVMDAQCVDLDQTFDVIIASDCLEHLEKDQQALMQWHRMLNAGGKIYVFVPAFMFLWSKHDTANMHHRRYLKSNLSSKMNKAGFKIDKASYWNFLLFLPIAIIRTTNRWLALSKADNKGDLDTIPRFNTLLYSLIELENKWLVNYNFPFGVSVFCIGSKL